MINAISLQGTSGSDPPCWASQVNSLATRQQRMEKMFQNADANGDGSISKDEFLNISEQMQAHRPQGAQNANAPSPDDIFKKLDTDGDGKISKDEFTAMLSKKQGTGHPMGGPRMGGAMGGGMAKPMGNSAGATGSQGKDSSSSASQTTDPADTNGDGVVSLAERLAYINKEAEASQQTSDGILNLLA